MTEQNEPWINTEEWRDLPTSDENGTTICYADTLDWVVERLMTDARADARATVDELSASALGPNVGKADSGENETAEWHAVVEAAERTIANLCSLGKLVAYGYKENHGAFERMASPVPTEAWPSLWIDITKGQPESDRQEHGGREYGQALCRDQADSYTFDVAWTAVHFRKADVLTHWPARAGAVARRRRGRKPKYDWPDARDFAFKLLNERGPFREWDDCDWKSQADLERAVLVYMERPPVEPGNGPVESTIRTYVAEWLAEWRPNSAEGQ